MHSRFWNWSVKATAEYRNLLENSVKSYDQSNDAITYTQPTAALLLSILGIASTVLTNTMGDAANENTQTSLKAIAGLQLAIPTAAIFVVLICKLSSRKSEDAAKSMIAQGIKLGYFNYPPSFPDNSDATLAIDIHENNEAFKLQEAAAVERILRRRG